MELISVSSHRDRGAAAVEMALVLPLLLLIVFGIIDFGRMLNAQISVTEAAREGARAATIDTSDGAAQARVDRIDTAYLVDDAASTPCGEAPGVGDDATIVVNYTFSWITPIGGIGAIFGGDGMSGDITIQGRGVMPCRA
jgi:Flp pilus assembly protein TadG